jgi:Domain of unknown function (DUF4249)
MKLIGMFSLLLFVSCLKDTKKKYTIDYEGDKIVINGFIDPTEGCVVNVSKCVSSSNMVSLADFEVLNPRVYLIENGIVVRELKSMGKGLFKSDSLVVQIGKNYAIRASANQLETVESETVIIPDSAHVSNLTMAKDSLSFSTKRRIFNFKLTDRQIGQRNFFRLNLRDQNERVIGYKYLDGLNINTVECDFNDYDNITSGGSFTYFSDKCFDNNFIIADYIAQYSSSRTDLVTLTFEVTGTSKEFFDYCKSIQQPFGRERAFLEPQSLYTNIKNGYGIFYAQNAKKYTFKL